MSKLVPVKIFAAGGENEARGANIKNAVILYSNNSGGGLIYKDKDGRVLQNAGMTILSGGGLK